MYWHTKISLIYTNRGSYQSHAAFFASFYFICMTSSLLLLWFCVCFYLALEWWTMSIFVLIWTYANIVWKLHNNGPMRSTLQLTKKSYLCSIPSNKMCSFPRYSYNIENTRITFFRIVLLTFFFIGKVGFFCYLLN